MFDPVINSLPAFAGYFATAIGLLAGVGLLTSSSRRITKWP